MSSNKKSYSRKSSASAHKSSHKRNASFVRN